MQNNITEPTPTQLYHAGGRKEGEPMLLKGGFYSVHGSLLKLAKYSWSMDGFKIYCTDLINKKGEYRFNYGLIVKSLDELVPCSVNEQHIIENVSYDMDGLNSVKTLGILASFEKSAKNYKNKVDRNNIKKFGIDWVIANRSRDRVNMSELYKNPFHNKAKPLTSFQKLYFIPDFPNVKVEIPGITKIKDSFKDFKKNRGLD